MKTIIARDVVRWHQENPGDWEKTWQLVNQKYQLNPDYRRIICERARKRGNGYKIDAKINGAYVVMGLLYGRRELDQTIAIATRCGQDSDCNPSSAGAMAPPGSRRSLHSASNRRRAKRDIKNPV